MVQVAILVKVTVEANPPNDCPLISVAIAMKDAQGSSQVSGYTAIGKGSTCVAAGMPEYIRAIPWAAFFHGTQLEIPKHIMAGGFLLDMYYIRDAVQDVYKVRATQHSSCLTLRLLQCVVYHSLDIRHVHACSCV